MIYLYCTLHTMFILFTIYDAWHSNLFENENEWKVLYLFVIHLLFIGYPGTVIMNWIRFTKWYLCYIFNVKHEENRTINKKKKQKKIDNNWLSLCWMNSVFYWPVSIAYQIQKECKWRRKRRKKALMKMLSAFIMQTNHDCVCACLCMYNRIIKNHFEWKLYLNLLDLSMERIRVSKQCYNIYT